MRPMKKLAMGLLVLLPICYANAYTCPDPNVEMVVANAIPQAKSDAEVIAGWGERALYKVKTLTVSEHTKHNMLSYMQCPRLQFFVNISHSSSTDIVLGDQSGTLSGNEIATNVNFNDNTIFYTHSCNSGAGTTQGSLVNGMKRAHAKAFIGTNRTVSCGSSSEDIIVAKCVIRSVLLRNKRFDNAIRQCTTSVGIPNFIVLNDFNKNWNLGLVTPALKAALHSHVEL